MITKLQKTINVLSELEINKPFVIKCKSIISVTFSIIRSSEYIYSMYVGGAVVLENKPLTHIEEYLESFVNDKNTKVFLSVKT